MDQNQTVDNDLQKAIDDITNNTNADPVFSDPVAAPSSIPEGDTGELSEAVGPFPESKIEMAGPEPEPIAPLEPISIPDLSVPTPEASTNAPETPIAPAPSPVPIPPSPIPPFEPPISEPTPMASPASTVEETFTTTTNFSPNSNLNTRQIKEAALRALAPLLDRLNMSPSQKFNICRNIFEDLHDYTVLEQAYRAATEIANETERAEALLYLVEFIDKM